MLNEFLFTKIKEDIGNIWFQQDGATCHAAEATLDVLRSVFEDRIISRRADVIWHRRTIICGDKDKCYVDKPETIDALKDNILEAIGEMQLHTIDNMHKNWADRLGYFEWNYFPLLTGRIILSNKKKEIWENVQWFFLSIFQKKGIWRTLYLDLV